MHSLLESNGLQVFYNVTIESSLLNKEMELQTSALASSFKAKGFRKGKAPLDLVKKHHGDTILKNALSKLLKLKVGDIIDENKYDLACSPSFSIEEELDHTKDVTVKICFELNPEIPEVDYSKIECDLPTIEVRPMDLDREIEGIVEAYTSLEPYEDAAHLAMPGDVVEVVIKAKVNKTVLADYRKKHQLVIAGEAMPFPDLGQLVLQKPVGDQFVAKLTIPAECHVEHLRGQEADFHIELYRIYSRITPKVDDELAVKLGSENLDSLHKKIKELIVNHYEYKLKMAMKASLLSRIVDDHPFELPPTILKVELEHYLKNVEERDESGNNIQKDNGEDIVAKRMRISYLLKHIMHKENITVTKEDFMNAVRRDAANRGISNVQQLMNAYVSNKQICAAMIEHVKENKIFDAIFDKISLKRDKVMNLDEINNFLEETSTTIA